MLSVLYVRERGQEGRGPSSRAGETAAAWAQLLDCSVSSQPDRLFQARRQALHTRAPTHLFAGGHQLASKELGGERVGLGSRRRRSATAWAELVSTGPQPCRYACSAGASAAARCAKARGAAGRAESRAASVTAAPRHKLSGGGLETATAAAAGARRAGAAADACGRCGGCSSRACRAAAAAPALRAASLGPWDGDGGGGRRRGTGAPPGRKQRRAAAVGCRRRGAGMPPGRK